MMQIVLFPQRILTDVFRVYIYVNKFTLKLQMNLKTTRKSTFNFCPTPSWGSTNPFSEISTNLRNWQVLFLYYASSMEAAANLLQASLYSYYNGMLEVGWNFVKRPKCNRTLAKALKKASKCSSEPLNWHQYEDKMKVHSKASSGQPESFLMTTFFFFSHVVISKWPTLRDVLYASTHKYNNVFVYLVSVSNKWTLIPPQRVPLAHFILTSR